uniref:PEM-1 protein n=1 Tax=Phallusia mammillata TaxID=59560 RepID=C9DQK8_9ASCI|nr:PEM-1 protein [Phallusia mammillata]
MVVSTAANMERNIALNRIFSEMGAVGRMQPVAPLSEIRMQNDVMIKLPGHVPVKRMASCPSSQHLRAMPKRTRVMATSTAPMAHSTAPYAVASPGKLMVNRTASSHCMTPSSNRKGLSFAPINRTRQEVLPSNCCTKENMCFGVLTSSVPVSTPPYGSTNFQFPSTESVKPVRRKSRPLLRKSRRKTYPYKGHVISNTKTDEQFELKRRESLKSQPNALVMYNSFLRQMEKEGTKQSKSIKKDQLNQSTGYNRGFTPNMTSTPQHKSNTMTSQTPRKAPVTSDYYSSSPKSSGFDDSFDAFLKFIEDGALAANEKELMKQCSLSRHTNEHCDGSGSNKGESGSTTPSSGFGSLSESESRRKELPQMFPIGAPLAASSPLQTHCPVSATSGGLEFGSDVWRPWC